MAIYKIVLFVLSNSIIICQALSFKAVLVLNGLTSNDIPDNSPTYESIIGYIPTLSLKKELSTHKLIDVEWAYHLKRHYKGGLLFNYNENNHRLWIRYSSNKIEARLGIQKIVKDSLTQKENLGLIKNIYYQKKKNYMLKVGNFLKQHY